MSKLNTELKINTCGELTNYQAQAFYSTAQDLTKYCYSEEILLKYVDSISLSMFKDEYLEFNVMKIEFNLGYIIYVEIPFDSEERDVVFSVAKTVAQFLREVTSSLYEHKMMIEEPERFAALRWINEVSSKC